MKETLAAITPPWIMAIASTGLTLSQVSTLAGTVCYIVTIAYTIHRWRKGK